MRPHIKVSLPQKEEFIKTVFPNECVITQETYTTWLANVKILLYLPNRSHDSRA
jgi:hypothetical protein